MKILALDPGTKTGWAIAGSPPLYGVQDFTPKRGDSPGMRFLRFRAWLKDVDKMAGEVDVVGYEQPHHRGGHATAVLVGLVTEIHTFCAARGIQHISVRPNTLKKFATGNGRASKYDMQCAAKVGYRLPEMPAEDAADALLVLSYVSNEMGVSDG